MLLLIWHEFQDFCGNKHHVDASCVDDVIKTRKFLFIWMLIASFYLINFCWPEFLCFCGGNHAIYKSTIMRILNVFRIGIFLFVWMLIASVYFINCHKHEIQSFYGSDTIWAYNEVDAYCVMTSQNREFYLCLNVDCLYLNCFWHEFQSFCEKNHLEPAWRLLFIGVIKK